LDQHTVPFAYLSRGWAIKDMDRDSAKFYKLGADSNIDRIHIVEASTGKDFYGPDDILTRLDNESPIAFKKIKLIYDEQHSPAPQVITQALNELTIIFKTAFCQNLRTKAMNNILSKLLKQIFKDFSKDDTIVLQKAILDDLENFRFTSFSFYVCISEVEKDSLCTSDNPVLLLDHSDLERDARKINGLTINPFFNFESNPVIVYPLNSSLLLCLTMVPTIYEYESEKDRYAPPRLMSFLSLLLTRGIRLVNLLLRRQSNCIFSRNVETLDTVINYMPPNLIVRRNKVSFDDQKLKSEINMVDGKSENIKNLARTLERNFFPPPEEREAIQRIVIVKDKFEL